MGYRNISALHHRPMPVGALPRVKPARRFSRNLMVGLGLIAVLHVFVVQISIVRGHSMKPALHDGDRLVVDRLAYNVADISRFDMVVLRYPTDPDVDFVKRVVGLPGDRVRLRNGVLYVNDHRVPQRFQPVADPRSMPERIVPPDHCFVLGDNRPISCDSRDFGAVDLQLVKGKVRACFWPLHRVSLF